MIEFLVICIILYYDTTTSFPIYGYDNTTT